MSQDTSTTFTDRYIFSMPMRVRDYEVDAQGIVNNANYLHYMEHTRHEFCRSAGVSFRQMREASVDPVLTKAEIEYKHPLGLGDDFVSCLNIERRGPLFIFEQDLFTPDGTPVIKARISVACLENGRLTRGESLAEAFKDYLK